jgi:hypothetical protein
MRDRPRLGWSSYDIRTYGSAQKWTSLENAELQHHDTKFDLRATVLLLGFIVCQVMHVFTFNAVYGLSVVVLIFLAAAEVDPLLPGKKHLIITKQARRVFAVSVFF